MDGPSQPEQKIIQQHITTETAQPPKEVAPVVVRVGVDSFGNQVNTGDEIVYIDPFGQAKLHAVNEQIGNYICAVVDPSSVDGVDKTLEKLGINIGNTSILNLDSEGYSEMIEVNGVKFVLRKRGEELILDYIDTEEHSKGGREFSYLEVSTSIQFVRGFAVLKGEDGESVKIATITHDKNLPSAVEIKPKDISSKEDALAFIEQKLPGFSREDIDTERFDDEISNIEENWSRFDDEILVSLGINPKKINSTEIKATIVFAYDYACQELLATAYAGQDIMKLSPEKKQAITKEFTDDLHKRARSVEVKIQEFEKKILGSKIPRSHPLVKASEHMRYILRQNHHFPAVCFAHKNTTTTYININYLIKEEMIPIQQLAEIIPHENGHAKSTARHEFEEIFNTVVYNLLPQHLDDKPYEDYPTGYLTAVGASTGGARHLLDEVIRLAEFVEENKDDEEKTKGYKANDIWTSFLMTAYTRVTHGRQNLDQASEPLPPFAGFFTVYEDLTGKKFEEEFEGSSDNDYRKMHDKQKEMPRAKHQRLFKRYLVDRIKSPFKKQN